MSKFWVFLSSVWQEAKKVNWPSKRALLSSTGVVMIILVFVALYLTAMDIGLLKFFEKVIYPVVFGA